MHYLGKLLSLSLAVLPLAQAAPIHKAADAEDVIPNSYIVVMKDDLTSETFDNHRNWVSNIHTRGGISRRVRGTEHGVRRTYDFGSLKGYAGIFDEDTIQSIANTPDVTIPILSFSILIPLLTNKLGCLDPARQSHEGLQARHPGGCSFLGTWPHLQRGGWRR